MAWFDMPPAVMRAYDRHRTRYEAERTLGLYQAMLIGSSQTAQPEFSREWLQELEHRISGETITRGERPKTFQELGAIDGINLVIED